MLWDASKFHAKCLLWVVVLALSVAQFIKEIISTFFCFFGFFLKKVQFLEIQVSFLPNSYLHFTSASQNYLLGKWACWILFQTNESVYYKMPQSNPRTVHHPVSLSSINDTLLMIPYLFVSGKVHGTITWAHYWSFGSNLSHLLSLSLLLQLSFSLWSLLTLIENGC